MPSRTRGVAVVAGGCSVDKFDLCCGQFRCPCLKAFFLLRRDVTPGHRPVVKIQNTGSTL